MAEIVPFFAIPFGFARLDDSAPLNERLRETFLQRAAAGAAYANPRPITRRNQQVYESRFDLFRWPEAPVQHLKEFCWRELIRWVCELNRYDDKVRAQLLLYADSWFHITRRGGFFALHNHPMASWSGVYCVDPGGHEPQHPDSGLLSFVSPVLTCSMFLDAANTRLQGPYAHGIRSLRLEPGQLVLFPSWILHEVTPFTGDGERITVSFNAWFGLASDSPPSA